MAQAAKITITFTILATTMWTVATAQSDCTNVLISMSPCLNYITGNSSRLSSQCCSQLDSVVRSSPQCLCQVLNGGGSSLGGVNVNRTLALALPGACNVQTPPISRCNAASPAATPTGTPEAPNSPSSGSRTIPSTEENGTSDGTLVNLSISLLVLLLVAASYGSISTVLV